MYEDYYGFTEKPFSLTPDPKYLYKSESHASAFELLQYAVRRREGFVVVTGDIGTGKTTLCRALLEQIDRKTFTALVLNPFLSEEDLLKLILQDFGVVSRDDVKRSRLAGVSKQDLIETLYDFLLSLLPLRASAVLIIDEAQNLPLPVLEQIRILSNLETDKEKLLQIVLVGQLNLRQLLRSPELRQLDQRVSIRYELKPLDRQEVAAYVAHRLTVAGSSAVSFLPKALDQVHRLSGGIPRLINLICDRALLAGYSARTNKITREMVDRAVDSLELRRPKARRFWLFGRVSMLLAGLLTGLFTAAAVPLLPRLLAAREPIARTAVASPVPARPIAAKTAETLRPREAAAISPERVALAPTLPGTTGETAAGRTSRRLPNQPFTILVASFPLGGSAAGVGPRAEGEIATMVRELESLGYPTYQADVDLGRRGAWRRVLVGAYADAADARRDEQRLRVMRDFADARMIAASIAASVDRASSVGGGAGAGAAQGSRR
jgi:general secretion pathway protein A